MSPKRFRIVVWTVVVAAIAGFGTYGYGLNRRAALEAQYMDAADSAQHRGDLAAAEQAYKRVLALDARFLPARVGLADIYELEGRVQKSLAEYRKAVAVDPRNPEAHAALASALMLHRRYPEATRCLERGVKVAPNEAHMRLMLTFCYRRSGDMEKARGSLADYGRLAPGSSATGRAMRAIARQAKQGPAKKSGKTTSPPAGAVGE
jgi:tetratricopeptide (TPR) repeat protein